MKSISTQIREASIKVTNARQLEDAYVKLNESITEWSLEIVNKVLEASEKKNKALKSAIKAVKDLYELFDLQAPKMKYLMDLDSALYKITNRWKYMLKSVNEWM